MSKVDGFGVSLHPAALIVDIFLRCQDCKTDILEPMDEAGLTPGPCDKIGCPTCGNVSMRVFWLEVPNPNRKQRPPVIVTVSTPR